MAAMVSTFADQVVFTSLYPPYAAGGSAITRILPTTLDPLCSGQSTYTMVQLCTAGNWARRLLARHSLTQEDEKNLPLHPLSLSTFPGATLSTLLTPGKKTMWVLFVSNYKPLW